MAPKSVLITGCSHGGIGSSLAETFQKRGLHVFATGRSLKKMAHLADLPNVTLLTLDVTSPSSIADAVKAVAAQTGGTLDYLVNNAGRNYICPTLDVDIAEAKAMFDVNFWGLCSCIQAFASLLIAAKGTIVNIGSFQSVLNVPYSSIYSASKAAISIFDEILRIEMAVLGVNVVTVVTGSVATNINAEGSGFKLQPNSRYKEIEATINDRAHGKDIPNQMNCQDYAEKVAGDVLGGVRGLGGDEGVRTGSDAEKVTELNEFMEFEKAGLSQSWRYQMLRGSILGAGASLIWDSVPLPGFHS